MKPMPKFVESIWLYTGRESGPELLGHAVLTVDVDGVWHVRQVVKTGWCQTETAETGHATEEQARAHMARIRAEGEPLGRWKVRTATG
jgi:hypothetical protein